MKAMKPGTGRHIAEALAVLYAPSTPETKAEADALAREHCARVRAGVPRVQRETDDGLFADVPETSGRCLGSKKTPADGARCFGVADVEAAGDMAAARVTPPGDPSTYSSAA